MKIRKKRSVLLIFLFCLNMVTSAFCDNINEPLTNLHDPLNIKQNNNNPHLDLSLWSTFANSIEHCTPGAFNLPDPAEIIILSLAQAAISDDHNAKKTSEQDIVAALKKAVIYYRIIGLTEDKCLVVVEKKEEMFDPDHNKLYHLDCGFTKVKRELISSQAKEIASGNFEKIDPNALDKTLEEQCILRIETTLNPSSKRVHAKFN